MLREEDVPTAQPPSAAGSRVPRPDEDRQRAEGAEAAESQGASPAGGLSLPIPDERLRCRKAFQTLYQRGRSIRGSFMVLIFIPNGRAETRRAFVTSKKIGSAVVRNRCRRRLREAHLRIRGQVDLRGVDLALVARARCKDASFQDLLEEMERLYRAAGFGPPSGSDREDLAKA